MACTRASEAKKSERLEGHEEGARAGDARAPFSVVQVEKRIGGTRSYFANGTSLFRADDGEGPHPRFIEYFAKSDKWHFFSSGLWKSSWKNGVKDGQFAEFTETLSDCWMGEFKDGVKDELWLHWTGKECANSDGTAKSGGGPETITGWTVFEAGKELASDSRLSWFVAHQKELLKSPARTRRMLDTLLSELPEKSKSSDAVALLNAIDGAEAQQAEGMTRGSAKYDGIYKQQCDAGEARGCLYLGRRKRYSATDESNKGKEAGLGAAALLLFTRACELGSADGCSEGHELLLKGPPEQLSAVMASPKFRKLVEKGCALGDQACCKRLDFINGKGSASSPPACSGSAVKRPVQFGNFQALCDDEKGAACLGLRLGSGQHTQAESRSAAVACCCEIR